MLSTIGGDFARFPSLEDAPSSLASRSRRRVGCDRYQRILHAPPIVSEWKFDFFVHDARRLVCTNQADMTGRLLAGSLAFESRILHYLIVRILLPRSSNLAQVSEEDLIVMWAFHKGLQIDWAHLVRYRMHKALRLNAPLHIHT